MIYVSSWASICVKKEKRKRNKNYMAKDKSSDDT